MVQSATTGSDLPPPTQGLKTLLKRYCIPSSARWGCACTLHLGESNLEYDVVCKPSKLHCLKRSPYDQNQMVYTTLQILESWIHMAQQMLKRVAERVTELVKAQKFEKARIDCYLIERIWKLLFKTKFLLEFGFGFVCVCVCFFFFFGCVFGWQERSISGFVCVFVFGWQERARKS